MKELYELADSIQVQHEALSIDFFYIIFILFWNFLYGWFTGPLDF